MPEITLSISDELNQVLLAQAQAKGFTTVEDYLHQLMENAELEAQLLSGVESLERGEGQPMTSKDWQQLHQKVRDC